MIGILNRCNEKKSKEAKRGSLMWESFYYDLEPLPFIYFQMTNHVIKKLCSLQPLLHFGNHICKET